MALYMANGKTLLVVQDFFLRGKLQAYTKLSVPRDQNFNVSLTKILGLAEVSQVSLRQQKCLIESVEKKGMHPWICSL